MLQEKNNRFNGGNRRYGAKGLDTFMDEKSKTTPEVQEVYDKKEDKRVGKKPVETKDTPK